MSYAFLDTLRQSLSDCISQRSRQYTHGIKLDGIVITKHGLLRHGYLHALVEGQFRTCLSVVRAVSKGGVSPHPLVAAGTRPVTIHTNICGVVDHGVCRRSSSVQCNIVNLLFLRLMNGCEVVRRRALSSIQSTNTWERLELTVNGGKHVSSYAIHCHLPLGSTLTR